jgi:hypothetical protein
MPDLILGFVALGAADAFWFDGFRRPSGVIPYPQRQTHIP